MQAQDNQLHFIDDIHPSYDPLHFVLMYPRGESGWSNNIPYGVQGVIPDGAVPSRHNRVTAMQFACYFMMVSVLLLYLTVYMTSALLNPASLTHVPLGQDRPGHCLITHFRRLYQEWLVDQFVKCESQRLSYYRHNQTQLRADLYQGVVDAVAAGDGENVGWRVILPGTHTCSPRNMVGNFQDAMAIVRKFGRPDLFITFTCNPNWAEIKAELRPGQSPNDRPDIIDRVFHLKLSALLKEIDHGEIFGTVKSYIHVIEFQKRYVVVSHSMCDCELTVGSYVTCSGLPHAHILVILDHADKLNDAELIDATVTAQLPDPVTQPRLYKIVSESMIHGPCGAVNTRAPCMDAGPPPKCTKKYPKEFRENTTVGEDAYAQYRRPDNGRHTVRRVNSPG